MQILRRFLPLVIALVVAVLVVVKRHTLFQTLGVGIAPLILVTAFILWAIWKHRLSIFLRYWRYWIGGIAFAASLLALLSFFRPENFLHDFSLGGNWGNSIKGTYSSTFITDLLGALRITVLIILGIAFVTPGFAFKLSRGIAERGLSVLGQSGKNHRLAG